MAGLIAGVVATIYYRAMLRYAIRGDATSVQLVMKNFVLYAAILTLTFGIATPKCRLRAALTHPNIVEVYDYGRAEDGAYYYVMEYLPGLSLEELVERHEIGRAHV